MGILFSIFVHFACFVVLYLFLTTKYAKNAKKSDELVSHVLPINPVNFAEFHHSLLHNPGFKLLFYKVWSEK